MTNEQLLNTRPVLSGLKSITEAEQAVADIRDKAKDMVSACTDELPITGGDSGTDDFYSTGANVDIPKSKTDGKYFKVSRAKLLELNKGINYERELLAQLICTNQQDQRTLRASEKTRDQISELRAETRERNVQLLNDANTVSAQIASPQFSQSQLANSARALIRSADAVEAKLKEMEKVLKHEQNPPSSGGLGLGLFRKKD